MRRALGRGLSQLLAEELDSTPREAPIGAIEPNPRQPRTVFDEAGLHELAESIQEHGILQPLVVRPKSEGRYELIAGERRWRAARIAGLTAVPIIVRSADARDSLELALIENLQREDIGPVERSMAYRRLIEEFELTQEDVAKRVGKARASVANTIRLARLPEEILAGLQGGSITEGHAKALLALDDPNDQLALFRRVVKAGMNVRDTERAAKPSSSAPLKKSGSPDPNDEALMDALQAFLGSPARIVRQGQGGRLVIDFFSDEDLERLLDTVGFSL